MDPESNPNAPKEPFTEDELWDITVNVLPFLDHFERRSFTYEPDKTDIIAVFNDPVLKRPTREWVLTEPTA